MDSDGPSVYSHSSTYGVASKVHMISEINENRIHEYCGLSIAIT